MSARHLLLVGFMGAGKSCVGQRVAELLGRPFVDLDEAIVARAGRSIPEIFEADGEARFRETETAALVGLVPEPPSVVATGGGIVHSLENRQMMHLLGNVIYLEVSIEEALARIGDADGRPLLAEGPVAAARLLDGREELYRAAADVAVDTVGETVDEIAAKVAQEARRLEGAA